MKNPKKSCPQLTKIKTKNNVVNAFTIFPLVFLFFPEAFLTYPQILLVALLRFRCFSLGFVNFAAVSLFLPRFRCTFVVFPEVLLCFATLLLDFGTFCYV